MRHATIGLALACGTAQAANPVRKVVTMLQNVQKKVEAEGKKETEMFEKFLCYCSTSGTTLKDSIESAEVKGPQVASEIEEAAAQQKQFGEDLKKHSADRVSAKEAVAEATALREKEAGIYAALKDETSNQIKAIGKAVAAIEKGSGESFLQTGYADTLRNLVQSNDKIVDADRQELTSFLAAGASYEPASGEITGILKQMGDEMSASLAGATKDEQAAIKSFEGAIAAKNKEIAACTKAIEEKTVRVGELKVSIVEMKQDMSDTEEQLVEDKKFLKDLEKNCATAQEDWDAVCKVRSEELVALADTIKILNDDDALELFKKTLPGASSFIQLRVGASAVKARALAVLREAKHQPQIDLIALALHGKKVSFDGVLKMIDDMVVLLKKEQVDDDKKKAYCAKQFDELDDQKKVLDRSISDSEVSIEDANEAVKQIASDVEALTTGIADLDKSVAEATENRKEQNAEFTELMAQDGAAKELLGVAKNRLNKFYNPKQYIPPKGEEAELVSVSVHVQDEAAPPPPPELPGAHKKKSEETNGVIAMLDELIAELDKEMTVAKTEEKDAQADYEQMMDDSSEKRSADSKTIEEKEGVKADTEAALTKHNEELKSQKKEMMATLETIQAMHGECDWLLQYFDVRKEARANEIGAMTKAKAVLSGADYSLLQTRSLRGRK